MTITKQDTIDYSNGITNEHDILVPAEAINSDVPPLITIAEQDVALAEPTMTTDLIVASNATAIEDNKSDTHSADAVETTDAPSDEPDVSNVAKPDLEEMKRRRVRSQVAAGWIGGATGLVVLGLPGAIIGGIVGNKVTKHSLKRLETKAKKDYELRVAEEQFTPPNHNEEVLVTRAVVA